ncbi:Essential protein Yae1, N-terminal [Ostreococcus tauri]|uniref:Essential protein Yae1, N-terminal n=1 Tax=Ostreococcus tauri TaxID=70448 RepID=A0A090M268_OSTTA|nr:Essential protein Yae1, N-terminal [Ostreococcus tauri]CEF98291.1 Essential protein Yae1, N-terminal [Ostreococcus tauri]|eukprot:XP_022839187.1 Essential protein Yae1, N-terminal [Ostreococcus tauri]
MPCADPWAVSDDDADHVDASRAEHHVPEHVVDERVERRKHHNAGYLDGLEDGKDETLQSGFNAGFVDGGTAGFAYGQARGATRTLRAFAERAGGSEEWVEAMQANEERLKTMTSVRALKAAHAESLDDGQSEFTVAMKALESDIQAVGAVTLHEFPR